MSLCEKCKRKPNSTNHHSHSSPQTPPPPPINKDDTKWASDTQTVSPRFGGAVLYSWKSFIHNERAEPAKPKRRSEVAPCRSLAWSAEEGGAKNTRNNTHTYTHKQIGTQQQPGARERSGFRAWAEIQTRDTFQEWKKVYFSNIQGFFSPINNVFVVIRKQKLLLHPHVTSTHV